jgi:hypothetical protein
MVAIGRVSDQHTRQKRVGLVTVPAVESIGAVVGSQLVAPHELVGIVDKAGVTKEARTILVTGLNRSLVMA